MKLSIIKRKLKIPTFLRRSLFVKYSKILFICYIDFHLLQGMEDKQHIEEDRRDSMNKAFDSALDNIKTRKRSINEDFISEDRVYELKRKMREAVLKDRECIVKRGPALNRQKILKEVQMSLERKIDQEIYLDCNILEEIKYWLEPLKIGVFPCTEMREKLLRVLDNLPIEKDHLLNSGIGRIIYFYSKTISTSMLQTRKLSKGLVKKWTREFIL
eukprot:GHVP01033330.1.p1 GENE.GHVP01033330.1~~GHVP01033330.1.p1  ORF type:complete len:215 (+),score=48.92 GHVP01033330.1:600-1244(+)